MGALVREDDLVEGLEDGLHVGVDGLHGVLDVLEQEHLPGEEGEDGGQEVVHHSVAAVVLVLARFEQELHGRAAEGDFVGVGVGSWWHTVGRSKSLKRNYKIPSIISF